MSGTTIRRDPREERAKPNVPTVRVLYTPGADALSSHGVSSSASARNKRQHRLELGANTIGRADGTLVTLAADGQVSRVHATITVEPSGAKRSSGVLGAFAIHISDSSTNGTYVQGKRVAEKTAPLADGDVIRVGDSVLLLRMVAEDGVDEEPEAYGLLGDAPVMHEVRRTLKLVGPTDATVLISGPSGTGKEVVARALHRAGRPNGPFVAVNCSAIPETLAESQLFGHIAGAFTGAKSDHQGFFRAANRGVIFLDEIGELPLGLQAKLLRALEERAVIPVGAVHTVPFDARVVAATNRRLAFEIANGRFRGDLLARLTEIEITMPPLRDRAEDVLPLLGHALREGSTTTTTASTAEQQVPLQISPDLAEALVLYEWPYNVRELFKVAAELRIRGAGSKVLDLRLVAERLRRQPVPVPVLAVPSSLVEGGASSRDSKEQRAAAVVAIPTRDELVALLSEHRGSVADVARATGRSRKQVYRWIESHGIDVDSFRAPES